MCFLRPCFGTLWAIGLSGNSLTNFQEFLSLPRLVLVSAPFSDPKNVSSTSELIHNTGAEGEEDEEPQSLRYVCRFNALIGKNSKSLDVFVAGYFQCASSGLAQGKLSDRHFRVCTCSYVQPSPALHTVACHPLSSSHPIQSHAVNATHFWSPSQFISVLCSTLWSG